MQVLCRRSKISKSTSEKEYNGKTIFLVGYEKGPFSEEKVDRFLGEMKKKYQTVIDDTKRQRVSKQFQLVGSLSTFSVHWVLLFVLFCIL